MNTFDDSTILSNKKKTRSFVSFFLDKQIPVNTNEQIQIKDNSFEYLQILDELINKNNSCFGFSLLNLTSKYCLYMSIIIYLGICLIISLIAILKK